MNTGYFEALETGEIIITGHCQPELAEERQPMFGGQIFLAEIAALEGVDGTTHYYDFGEEVFAIRPEIAKPTTDLIADGVSELDIAFPAGTEVWINDQRVVVVGDDGLTLTSDTPGRMTVRAKAPFPFRPFEHTVNVHEV